MTFKQMQFATILFGLEKVIHRTAKKYPAFKARLAEKNFTAQIKIIDDSVGRYFTFDKGKVFSRRGLHDNPDICMMFKDAGLAVKLLLPPRNHLAMINAMKNFQIGLQGPDDLTMWFMETLNQILTSGMVRHRCGQRRQALYQQYQRRAGFCLCERQQDYPYYADRIR
jgi:trimethylamine-N-oxide reductase (cytochrome c)